MGVDIRPAGLRSIAALLVVTSLSPARAAQPAATRTAREASGWLVAQQHATGAFGGATQPADQVAEAMAALAVAGVGGEARTRALTLIRRDGPARASQQAAYAARIALGLLAVGEDPRDFDGVDYVAAIRAQYNELLGTHGGNLYAEALAGLGRVAAGDTLPPAYLDRLQSAQCPGGGYAYSDRCGRPPDADTTSLVLSVLALAGTPNSAPAISPSLAWLRGLQASSGGFPLEDTFEPNANSTGLVVTMLATLRINPRTWRRDADPIQALARFATADGALAFTAGGRANLWATVQGIPGLLAAPFPFRARDASAVSEPHASPRASDTPTARRTETTATDPPLESSAVPLSPRGPASDPLPVAVPVRPTAASEAARQGVGIWLWGPALLLLFFAGASVAVRWRAR